MMRVHFLILLSYASLFGQTPNDQAAWNVLDKALGDKSSSTRAKAVHELGLLKDNSRAQVHAEKLLADSDPKVRAAAATALGRMGAKSSAQKLIALFDDHESDVVFAAASALRALDNPLAYSVYYATLTGEKKSGEGLIESQLKIIKDPKAMAKIGFEQGIGFVPYGGAALQAYRTITKDDESPIRAAAAQQLASDPDPRSAKALTNALMDKKWLVRGAAADAIGKRDDPTLMDSLVPLFTDEEEVVRLSAAAAYIRLSAKQK
jgi:HEAT repeat protein